MPRELHLQVSLTHRDKCESLVDNRSGVPLNTIIVPIFPFSSLNTCAIIDGASEEELQVIRDKVIKLKADRDGAINEINGVIEIEEITNINTDLSTGF